MSDSIRELLKDLADFENTPESRGYELRIDLSEIIAKHLRQKGWTQTRLAEAAGMQPPQLTRVMHAASNCTFDVAGRILFALGIRAKLVETEPADEDKLHAVEDTASPRIGIRFEDTINGKEAKGRRFQEETTSDPRLDTKG